jgi:replicative DNA helicase
MHDLFLRRKTIDVVTVSDYLTKKKEIDNIGGMQYLYDISLFLPTSA